jgi:hypothetical protein
MAISLTSTKKLKIDKANATTVSVIPLAAFVVVFSLTSIKALFSQYQYQRRVTSAQQTTLNQLNGDETAGTALINSYKTFVNQPSNIIGGSSTGTGPRDGNSAKIVLDALPSSYDFPAFVTSLQNLLVSDGVAISGITGTDTGGAASAAQPVSTGPTSTSTSGPSQIPFTFTVQGPYTAIQNVISSLQNSIRPIKVSSIIFSGSDTSLSVTVTAVTYYQTGSGLNIGTEIVK